MGKSGASCLSIISCGRGSAHDDDDDDDDDLRLSESGASSDKRRWSFRKRSAHHRVLSNTVISEPLPLVSINKESPEASCNTSSPTENPFTLEKISSPKKTNECLQQSLGTVDAKVVDASLTMEDTIKPDPGVKESAASLIQAAIRGYLVRKEMQKLRSVVKLQAAVRGHLVRRQAAGTLRCVQAIIKMQALVRARIVRQSVENLTNQEKLDTTSQTDNEMLKSLDKESSGDKQKKSYSPTEKLLTNGFTRQLLESTPKTKPIHIHCDPSKSDSAWKWLERWMAFSSSDVGQEHNLKPASQERRKSTELGSFDVIDEGPAAVDIVSADANSAPVLIAQTEDLIINSATDFEFHASTPNRLECLSPQEKDDWGHNQPENDVLNVTDENCAKNGNTKETSGLNSDEVIGKSASILLSPDTPSDKPDEKVDHLTERRPCDSLETEDKKFVFGTRKVCNSAFAAAQAKFEELSSAGSLRSKSYNQDISIGSRSENIPCDSFTKANVNITEESISHDPGVQTATSECGTEISVSSTLDSPDRSEAEGGEIVLEIGAMERGDCNENSGSNNAFEDLNFDTKNMPAAETLQPSVVEVTDENPTNLIAAVDSVEVEQKPSLEHLAKPISSDINVHQENVIDHEASKSTPEGSPRSHITAPESHGTPSSQISVNTKKSKVGNNLHVRKQRSKVAGEKRSPSNLDPNSGGRSSTEHLPRDTKIAKRRNSFGMATSDHVEHEPRASTSNSLPNYMQATESARAKVASNSPKSSPDVHKDSYTRKRHSLPMGNGKQDSSPRIQRSSSQMQQNAKQNGTLSPHNSAERRWQR